MKRNQFKFYQYRFEKLQLVENKLTLSKKDGVLLPNSSNLFYDMIYRIQEKAYVPVYDKDIVDEDEVITTVKCNDNIMEEFFILKAPSMGDGERDEDKRKLYAYMMQEGIYIDDVHYVREGAVKSASQTRTQKTMFIREDLKDKITEYSTLGRKPEKTVIAKMETAKGLLLSSALLLEDCMPRIVIVPDYEITLKANVRVVEEYVPSETEVSEEEQQYLLDKEKEKLRWDEIGKAVEAAKEKLTQEYLKDNISKRSYDERHTYKTRSKWQEENNRRVKSEEVANPRRRIKFDGNNYPAYHMNQTEEIKIFPIKPYSVGFDVVEKKDYPVKINCFDGQGIADISWMKKVSEKLELKYTTQGIQFRLPYIKGYIVSFPIQQWAKDNKVSKIKDIWGTEWDLFEDEIDIILCESCFKAKLDKSKEGLQQWLFSSMNDYYDSLTKYGYTKIGVAAYTKPKYLKEPYAELTYQHLYASNLSYMDIVKISSKIGRVGIEIKNGIDMGFTKAYLNMLASDEENSEDEEQYVNIINKAIQINHRMLFDPHIRMFLVGQSKRIFENLMLGKAYVRGGYKYACGDLIAMAQHCFNILVVGFLGEKECYIAGDTGERVAIRIPITHYSEANKINLIDSDIKYIRHLDNVIQFSAGKDLSMSQMNMDYDGDKVLVVKNKTLQARHIDALPIVNVEDKTTAEPLEYNLDNIIAYEMMNLHQQTSTITNIDTFFNNKAMEESGDLTSRDFEITICRHLQGLIIDSAKSMKKIIIPELLQTASCRKPYFMSNKYGDYNEKPNSYQERTYAKSPFNRFVKDLEDYIKETYKMEIGMANILDPQYLDIQSTKDLLQDTSKFSGKEFFEIIEHLLPIYKEFIKEKSEIDKKKSRINYKDKSDGTKDEIAVIKQEYDGLFEKTRTACNKVCSNQSVLASACVEISYNYTKNKNNTDFSRTSEFGFPWYIAPEGILENLKVHEDEHKIDVVEVRELNHQIKEYKGILRVDGDVASIDDFKFYSRDLFDGSYNLYNILGQHFADMDVLHKTPVRITESGTIKSDTMLEAINNYTVKLIKFENKPVNEVIDLLRDGFVLRKRNTDIALYSGDTYVASVRFEDTRNMEQGIMLEEYVGQTFVMKSIGDIKDKSVFITISNQLIEAIC